MRHRPSRHKTAAGVGGAYDETRYLFNRKGQTWKTIDPAGNEWVYTYDAKGRQASSKDPDKGTSYSEYNDYNELVKSTDSRGEALFRVYDQIGRKKELRDDSATGALRAEWKYDTLYSGQTGFRGQQTQTIRYEPAGSANAYKWQVRQFDGRYQPGGINIVIPAVETGLNTTYVYSYSYSSFTGAPTAITFPAAGDLPVEQITTDYDSVTGQPVRLDTNRTGQSGTMLATWYTAFGERSLTTRKLPGGVYVDDSIEYDDYTRQVKRTTVKPETAAGTVSDTNYSYDTAGNIISIAEKPQVGSSETQCFRYNRLNRLSTAWTPKSGVSCTPDPVVSDLGGPAQYWKDWTFDSTGGRLSEVSHAVAGNTTRAYTFPAGGAAVTRPHAVTRMTTSAPGVSDVSLNYQYDNAGNTICRPNGTAANTCPAGTGSQVPGWNAEGKLETVTGATTETSVYDINGVRLIRRDATGTTLYLPGQEIRREGTVNKGTRYYSFAGKTCASRNGTALTWLYGDHQGTDELSVRADTQAVSIRRQTPYGESRGTPPAWANQKGFVGGDKDATGLTNLGARRYDPVLGRFISVDPLLVATDPDQFNGYQYGGGNPIRFSDPTGERLEDDNGGDGRVTNPWSSDEEERANTGGADRAEMLRNFRRDQIKSGAKEMSAIRLKLMEMADIDFKAQGRGKGLATFVENWVEDKLFNTLLDTFLGRIDESRGNSEVRVGTKENGRGDFAGFNNEEFEIAFILAMDGSNVVSKDDNITSVGATNRRSFDAWVDGVRSEFKTPQKDSERSGKSAWEGADGQNAERLYIYSKTIDKKALGQGRSAHLSSKKGSSGTDYKHYRVVEMDVTGLHGWSTDLTPIGEPIDCNGWDWFVC